MPTGTAARLHEITFHVPVDRFEIVYGPRVDWTKTKESLDRSTVENPVYARHVFTLKTAASVEPFKRELSLATIFAFEGVTFHFTAIFCGKVVSGIYNTKTRTGWFNLD